MHTSFKKSVVFLCLIFFYAICLQVNYARNPGINSGKDAKVINGALFGDNGNISSKNAGNNKGIRVKRNASGTAGSGGTQGESVTNSSLALNSTETATGATPGHLSVMVTDVANSPPETSTSTTTTTTTTSTTTTTTKPEVKNTTFGDLSKDDETFAYDKLENGIWEIENTQKLVIKCPSKKASNTDKPEKIKLMAKNILGPKWDALREVVNSDSKKDNLEFELEINNNATGEFDKEYFKFIGDYKCEYFYDSESTPQFTTPVIKVRLGNVNFKVNVDVELKKNTKIACPNLDSVGMTEKSQIYFYNAYNNENEDGNNIQYVAFPKNAVRNYQNSTVLIKKFQRKNLGYYDCLYINSEKREVKIIYNVYSSKYNKIKVDVTHFYVISAFTLLSTIIIFVPLFFR
uniref:SUN domain-containing protein n=1 Tax=Strongyloides papillosus TaxID=174720 RepID=A0A0N5BEW7_STREA